MKLPCTWRTQSERSHSKSFSKGQRVTLVDQSPPGMAQHSRLCGEGKHKEGTDFNKLPKSAQRCVASE